MRSVCPHIWRWTVIAFVATVASQAQAHQQWLAPNVFVDTRESAWVTFDHTFGDQRFHPSSGPGSYYSWWFTGSDGLKRSIPFVFVGKTRTVGEVELEEPGTYRLEGVEDMMAWTLLKVDGEERWQPGSREEFAGREIVRSRVYFNKAVAYVSIGSDSRTLPEATGDPLEIVFSDHPNELQIGAGFSVRALASGKPLAEQEIRVYSEQGSGHDASFVCTTNASGACRIEVSTAGRYLLATNTTIDSATHPETDGSSYGYSVMVDVIEKD
ncbi:MAG: DUF4198 domain-containing protein [Pseudomonadota bacterium]